MNKFTTSREIRLASRPKTGPTLEQWNRAAPDGIDHAVEAFLGLFSGK